MKSEDILTLFGGGTALKEGVSKELIYIEGTRGEEVKVNMDSEPNLTPSNILLRNGYSRTIIH